MSIATELRVILAEPCGKTSAGHPYLPRHAWVRFRDWTPHILADGARVWAQLDLLEQELGPLTGIEVLRRVVNTAQITAPPDLWLIRQVVSALRELGLADLLAAGALVTPGDAGTRPEELRIDLDFLLSRGLLLRRGDGYRAAEHPGVPEIFRLPTLDTPFDLSHRWSCWLQGDPTDGALLTSVVDAQPALGPKPAPTWVPSVAEVELGWRLVPLVLGMRAAGVNHEQLPSPAVRVLQLAGALDDQGVPTAPGARMLARGPGPFGIIEAYHPYMAALSRILRDGRGSVHVQRGANVAASQDANRRTFARANDALDRFCADTGFAPQVFIEHAVGRGEAIRQRWARSGDDLTYVGADLEREALAATEAERGAGRLPADLLLVQADIGRPDVLIAALEGASIDPDGAVMVVGNGFHEVRGQTDERMVEVFAGYARAGLVLLFTEESALATDDLLHTAFNTYHAGFRYVHERSGQGLRPATAQPPSRLGRNLPASWAECATRAGYVRAEAWCSRSRTVYPHTPPSGVNPSISVSHFFVPRALADRLSLD